jgi:hypothetical protein
MDPLPVDRTLQFSKETRSIPRKSNRVIWVRFAMVSAGHPWCW